jgi:hypothetical protein
MDQSSAPGRTPRSTKMSSRRDEINQALSQIQNNTEQNEEVMRRLERKYLQYYNYWKDMSVAVAFFSFTGLVLAAVQWQETYKRA